MSGLPPKADLNGSSRHVAQVPKPAVSNRSKALFNHLVGSGEERSRHFQVKGRPHRQPRRVRLRARTRLDRPEDPAQGHLAAGQDPLRPGPAGPAGRCGDHEPRRRSAGCGGRQVRSEAPVRRHRGDVVRDRRRAGDVQRWCTQRRESSERTAPQCGGCRLPARRATLTITKGADAARLAAARDALLWVEYSVP